LDVGDLARTRAAGQPAAGLRGLDPDGHEAPGGGWDVILVMFLNAGCCSHHGISTISPCCDRILLSRRAWTPAEAGAHRALRPGADCYRVPFHPRVAGPVAERPVREVNFHAGVQPGAGNR